MGRVLTNNTGFQYAIESTPGVLPGSPVWNIIEPNSLGAFGSTFNTVAREPISVNRQNQAGTIVDEDSSVEFEADLILSHFLDFIEGYCFASFVGPVGAQNTPTAVSALEYTIPAIASAIPTGRLVFARGFSVTGNNGLKVVTGGTTTTVAASGLAVEASPPTNASLEVAGVEGATGDLEIDGNGNLISTALDFTTLGLTPGQWIFLPSATNQGFSNAVNQGYARVVSIAANLLTLDRKQNAFVTDNGAGIQVRVFFGRFVRNVAVGATDFLERYFQFEGAWDNLADPGPGTEYEYAVGNLCNELTFNIAGQDKATANFGFIGLRSEAITGTRKTNADTPISPNQRQAFNTTSDVGRLRIAQLDETGITTCFNTLGLTLANNVSPEKCIGTLGAQFLNTGNFQVTMDATILFTSAAVVNAIRANTTVSFDFALKNSDGAIYMDIPSMKLGNGARDLPVNESVRVQTTGNAFQDPTLGYSLGASLFPHLP